MAHPAFVHLVRLARLARYATQPVAASAQVYDYCAAMSTPLAPALTAARDRLVLETEVRAPAGPPRAWTRASAALGTRTR